MHLWDRMYQLLDRVGRGVPGRMLMLAALTCGAFSNTLFNGFHLDDFYRVTNNPGIQQVSRPWVHFLDPRTMTTLERITGYRPLLPLSLSVNYAIGGENVVGYHVFNILFQVVAAWFVMLLVAELLGLAEVEPGRARWVSLVVAAVFAVHPVSGIAVNYICARDLLLMQLFWGASFWAYLRMRRLGFTPLRWAGVMLLLLASLCAKGEAVVAPAMVFCLEVTLGGRSWRTLSPWLRSLPMALVVLGFFAFPKIVLGYSELGNVVAHPGSYWTYPLTQARVHLFHYLPNFLWPFPIRQDPDEPAAHGLDAMVAAGLVFIALTLVAAWRLRRREPILAYCILGYWVMYLTTSVVVPFHHLAVDYRPYPSSPFLYLALVLLVLRLPRPRWLQVLTVAAVAWATGTSFHLNYTWRNEWTLWRHSVDHGGGPLAHLNLAMATRNLPERRKLLEEALRVAPDYLLVLVNLGRTEVALGETEQGLDRIRRAVTLAQHDAQVRYWYAVTLAELGKKDQAAPQSARAADDDAHNQLYQLRAVQDAQAIDDDVTALRYLARLKAMAPRHGEAGFLEGVSLEHLGRADEALAAWRAFLDHHPDHVRARFALAHLLMSSGKCAQAIPEFTRVLQLEPARKEAHLHLGRCYAETGNAAEGAIHQRAYEAASPPAGP